jgi:hypothetical protein
VRVGHKQRHPVARRDPEVREDGRRAVDPLAELDSSARLTGRVDAPLDAVAIDDRVELRIDDPGTTDIDPSFDLSYETAWPVHVFELV